MAAFEHLFLDGPGPWTGVLISHEAEGAAAGAVALDAAAVEHS
jgi:hypothetical protein